MNGLFQHPKEALVNILPPEILLKIFKHFNFNELLSASKVCKKWRECTQFTDLWDRGSFTIKRGKLRSFLKFLKDKKDLRTLEIKYGNEDNANAANKLSYANGDENLMFTECLIGMNKLVCLRLLIHFEISYLPDTIIHMHLVPRKGHTDSDLERISRIPSLERLTFEPYGHPCCTKSRLKHFIRTKKRTLKHLSISCLSFQVSFLKKISRFENLVSLCLWKFNDGWPPAFQHICTIPSLRYLYIETVYGWENTIGLALKEFKFRNIEYFSISVPYEESENSFLRRLTSAMPNLKTLCVKNLYFTCDQLELFLRTVLKLEKFILHHDVDIEMPSVVMCHLHRGCHRSPGLKVCICNVKFDYNSYTTSYSRFWKYYHKNNFKCSICNLYYDIFKCDCF